MSDASQTTSQPAAVAKPEAAPAQPPPAEKPKEPETDWRAKAEAAEKEAKKHAKEIEAARKAESEAAAKLSQLSELLGISKKADPLEELQKKLASSTEQTAKLESRLRSHVLIEAARAHAPDAHVPLDVLRLMNFDAEVDIDAGKLKDEDAFKAALDGMRKEKPHLFKAPADPAANRGTPFAAPQPPAPPTTKTEGAAPAAPVQLSGFALWSAPINAARDAVNRLREGAQKQ